MMDRGPLFVYSAMFGFLVSRRLVGDGVVFSLSTSRHLSRRNANFELASRIWHLARWLTSLRCPKGVLFAVLLYHGVFYLVCILWVSWRFGRFGPLAVLASGSLQSPPLPLPLLLPVVPPPLSPALFPCSSRPALLFSPFPSALSSILLPVFFFCFPLSLSSHTLPWFWTAVFQTQLTFSCFC